MEQHESREYRGTTGDDDRSLLVSVPHAARLLGIGLTLTWDLVQPGALPTIRLGRRVLVPRAALEQLTRQSLEPQIGCSTRLLDPG